MPVVKEKSSSGFIVVLLTLGLIIIVILTFTSVEQVPAGTVYKLDGNKDQIVYFAPGGQNPPSGYQLKKVDTIQPGDEVVVKANREGKTTFRIDLPLMKRYVRVETPSGKTGWIALSILENKNQKTEIYRPE